MSTDHGLTPDSRRAIEWECARLIALYANLNDAARWADLAALYAVDGAMSRPSASDVFIQGRAAILAAFQSRPPRRTRHICSNVVIDVESAVAARGASAMILFTERNPPLAGSFDDRFVLTDDGWRFSERRGSLTFAD